MTSPTVRTNSWFSQSTNQLWRLEPNCDSQDINLGLCNGNYYYGRYRCAHTHEAGVTCLSTNLGRTRIRLEGGAGPWQGQILVKAPGNNWGGICWQYWHRNDADVICKTLQYRTHGHNTSFRSKKSDYPLFIKEFNCTGNESDIGMCKGSFDVYNCNHDAVSVDCSGGIKIRLQNGSNPFEGRVEVLLGGDWKTVCDSSFSTYDAKGICSTLGISSASPTQFSNSHFGKGNSTNIIYDLGCSGWESHIGQCVVQQNSGSCSHTDDAGVRCVDCYEEYDTDSGTIYSKQYPSYFNEKTDCIFVIRPAKMGSTSEPLLLKIEDLTNEYSRIIEVKEGSQGRLLSHIATYATSDQIVGKEFFVRYQKTSTSGDKFKITWKPLQRNDAVKVGCGTSSWDIAVNMTLMKQLYPDTIPELIYFPDSNCRGVWRGDSIFFSQKYTECRTQKQDKPSSVIYTNKLMYPDTNNPNPLVIRNFRWTIDVLCELDKINNAHVNFHPNEFDTTTHSNQGGHHGGVDIVTGSNKEGVDITFYKDPNFFEEVKGNPLQIHIGDKIYVKVRAHTTDNSYKMRLHSCVAKPQSYSSQPYTYPLIRDGCTVDSTTTIISQTTHETKFAFNAFEFQSNKDNVYVECNATFCLSNDNSASCRQACHTKRSAFVMTAAFVRKATSPLFYLTRDNAGSMVHDRQRRDVGNEVPAKSVALPNSWILYLTGSIGIFCILATAVFIYHKMYA